VVLTREIGDDVYARLSWGEDGSMSLLVGPGQPPQRREVRETGSERSLGM